LTALLNDEPEEESSEYDPIRSSHQVSLANARELLGAVLKGGGKYEEARKEVLAAVKAASDLVEQRNDHPEYLEARAAANEYLGTILRPLGLFEEEADAYDKATRDYRSLVYALPGVPGLEERLALTQTNLGSLLYKLRRADDAERQLSEAAHVFNHLVSGHPTENRYRAARAYCFGTLGRILRDRGRYEDATAVLDEAISELDAVIEAVAEDPEYPVPRYVETLALSQSHLGQTLGLMGQQDKIDGAFQAAVATLEKLTDKPSSSQEKLALVHQHWGNTLHDAGKHDEARKRFKESNEVWAALVASDKASPDHRHNYARFLVDCPVNDLRDAEAAIEILKQLTQQTPRNPIYWNTLGTAFYRNEAWQSSVDALQRTEEERESKQGRGLFILAMAKWQLNDRDEATKAYKAGLEWLEKTLPSNPDLRRIQREAAALLGVNREEE